MDKAFFTKNRQSLMHIIEDNSIVILFAGAAPQKSGDENYDFTPNRNFYYLTGIDRENMILMMVKSKNQLDETIFIEKSDPVLAKWVGEKMSANEVSEASGILNIEYIEDFHAKLNKVLFSQDYDNLYLDLERNDWECGAQKSHSFANEIGEKYPYINVKNAYHKINSLRLLKSSEEVEIIKKAIDITYKGIKNMMENSRPGMMEYEIEAYFNFALKSNGVTDFAFHTIAASGKNGTVLHYGQNNCQTGENDLILCDLGAEYKYYKADITRTFPVCGKFTERQKEIYNIVLMAQRAVIDMIKPGIPYKALNEKCKEVLARECVRIGLIKEEAEIVKYYYHGVSHYLGLDTHDVGTRDTDLKPGMVLTVEPGLYIEEESIGIRIEDNVLVTENGNEVLSKDIIKTVEDIEKFMEK